MSETDLQLGGGYVYQWECAIMLALNYFFSSRAILKPYQNWSRVFWAR